MAWLQCSSIKWSGSEVDPWIPRSPLDLCNRLVHKFPVCQGGAGNQQDDTQAHCKRSEQAVVILGDALTPTVTSARSDSHLSDFKQRPHAPTCPKGNSCNRPLVHGARNLLSSLRGVRHGMTFPLHHSLVNIVHHFERRKSTSDAFTSGL